MAAARSYYAILGVPRTESPSGIRTAYHELARRLHPDVAGEQATRAFQEASEAYGVLSDPDRRAAYNAELERGRDGAGRAAAGRELEPVESFEVLLTPAEAAYGSVVPLGISAIESCPQCEGTGRTWRFPCAMCRQRGVVATVVCVHLPPVPELGTTFDVVVPGGARVRLHVFVRRDRR